MRQGSYFPPFLEARKTSEKALVAVTQEAWIGGVSTQTGKRVKLIRSLDSNQADNSDDIVLSPAVRGTIGNSVLGWAV